jgi:hypothetical protein
MLVFGQTPVGILPIPKKNLDAGLRAFDMPITTQNFWSTKEFLEHNYLNLVRVFKAIITRCIELESRLLPRPVTVDIEAEKGLTVFPFTLTQGMTVTKAKVKIGPFGF